MRAPISQPIKLTGTSTTSIEDAINQAIGQAHLATKTPGWFQVVDTRGTIKAGKVTHWHVIIKVGNDLEVFDKKYFKARHFGTESTYKDR